jgi:hypothetical protein
MIRFPVSVVWSDRRAYPSVPLCAESVFELQDANGTSLVRSDDLATLDELCRLLNQGNSKDRPCPAEEYAI